MGYPKVADILREIEVKKYFLGILKSKLPDEDKLEKFIEFFDLEGKLEEKMEALGSLEDVSAAAQEIGAWQPRRILERIEDSLFRGIRRILYCQHPDNGWGYEWEKSNLWGTALSLMALDAATKVGVLTTEAKSPIQRGVMWVEQWLEGQVTESRQSTYDAALAVRCLHRLGRGDFPPVVKCVERLLLAQNEMGGWEFTVPIEVVGECEVGATAMVLAALSDGTLKGGRPLDAVKKAIQWLMDTQNEDGSWNEFFEEAPTLRATLSKTCDGLKGLNQGRSFALGRALQAKIDTQIEKGVEWIFEQEKLVGDSHGWGYQGLLTTDAVSTCIVLETLQDIKGVSLPLICANALWLTNVQHYDPSTLEDGKWIGGDSFRTTLALGEFLAKIRENPLFRISESAMAGN